MTDKQVHRQDVGTRSCYDTLMSFEMPEVWAVAYIVALIGFMIFMLTG